MRAPLPSHPDPTDARRLGRYELVMRVGAGAMGEVWAAVLCGGRGFRKLVAIKLLAPRFAATSAARRRFFREARLAARIHHPNVVTTIDFAEHEGAPYQVMEWVDGVSLARLLASTDGPVPVVIAARIVVSACAGLHAAHELRGANGKPVGLVHGDIAPENVLVTAEGITKIADFGLARVVGATSSLADADARLEAHVGYVAPECALGERPDRRADVFALGVVLYELLTGAQPFLAEDDRVTLARIACSDPVPAPSTRRAEVPLALDEATARALAKSPEDRFSTAAELARAIARAVPEAGLQGTDAAVADFVQRAAGATLGARRSGLRRMVTTPPPVSEPRSDASGVREASRSVEAIATTPSPPRARSASWIAATAAALALLGLVVTARAFAREPAHVAVARSLSPFVERTRAELVDRVSASAASASETPRAATAPIASASATPDVGAAHPAPATPPRTRPVSPRSSPRSGATIEHPYRPSGI